MGTRVKRKTTKVQQFDSQDFIDEKESDSYSKKGKKKNKIISKTANKQQDDTKKKKLKLPSAPTVYSPTLDGRMAVLVKYLQSMDVEGLLDGESGKDYSKYDCDMEVYKEWFDEHCEYQLEDGLMKPINLKESKLNTLKDFIIRTKDCYYWDSNQISKDIKKLFGRIYVKECKTVECYKYLGSVWTTSKVKIRATLEGFNKVVQEDLEKLFLIGLEHKVQVSKWPILPDKKDLRSYKEIADYEPNPNKEPYITIINEKLTTNKKPVKCKENCVCFDLDKMGSFSYAKITWDSECPNRRNRIECEEHEGTTKICYNQAIKHRDYKQSGPSFYDVEETICWGIDLYTRKNILNCLRKGFSEKERQDFISEKLMQAIHRKCEDMKDNTDMKGACNYIIENSRKGDQLFTRVDRKLAKGLKRAIRYDGQFEGFRIHTKGFGLVCVNEYGIKNNSLIIPYVGEIYQPWRWYEKQDFIKKQMKDANQKDILPDFYNIMLDMHKDDEKGMDYLFVDPINKGNYSSRLSHSCNPNCGTVTTISNGKYVIGMYAMRDIKYGEELTFDYCSFTESKAEQLQALCLCGQEKCKIFYLQLSNSKEYNGVLEKEHCFLVRNAILLKSCTQHQSGINELFQKYRIGSSLLKDCPEWLVNWVGYILKFIDEEKVLYKQELDMRYTLSQEVAQWNEFTVNNNADDRIQNLVFTLDKIKYFLLSTDSDKPPLQFVQDTQLVGDIWKDYLKFDGSEESLVQEIYQIFYQHSPRGTDLINAVFTQKKKMSPKDQMCMTRLMFLILSHILLQNTFPFHSEAISIVLYFMAFTYTYFKPFDYACFQSPPIEELEWRKVGAFKKKFKSEGRNYSSQFAWGQLVGWFKQTVVAPQASLSQDRRGTLSYPSFQSLNKVADRNYPFQASKNDSSRQYFMEHLLEKPSYMWPPELASWSYKNTYKLYGSVLFEHFYSEELGNDFLENVITKHTADMDEKLQLFKKYELIKNGHSESMIQKMFDNLQQFVGDNKLNINTVIRVNKRQRRSIQQYFNPIQNKREQFYEELKQQGKYDELDFIVRHSKILSLDLSK